MNTKQIWVIVIGVVVVLLAGYFVMQSRTESEVPSSAMPVPGSSVPETEVTSSMPVPGSDVSDMVVEPQ